jgi:hypothetical protein
MRAYSESVVEQEELAILRTLGSAGPDGNGYEPKGWLITGLLLAYSGLLLAYSASLSSEQCVSRIFG